MAKRNSIVRFIACLLFIICSFTGTVAQQAEVFPVVSVAPEIQFAELSDLTCDAHEDVFWTVSDDRQANGHQIFKIKIEDGEARITRDLLLRY